MSVLQQKAPFPHFFMKWIASEIDEYWTNDSSGGMPSLIDWFSGYDKWWIILNSPGSFFSTKPSGEHCKLENGLFSKGPWTLPAEISFCIFWSIISGLVRAEFKFFDYIPGHSPTKPK